MKGTSNKGGDTRVRVLLFLWKMWMSRDQLLDKKGVNGIVAVAIDRDKGSQHALKWAIHRSSAVAEPDGSASFMSARSLPLQVGKKRFDTPIGFLCCKNESWDIRFSFPSMFLICTMNVHRMFWQVPSLTRWPRSCSFLSVVSVCARMWVFPSRRNCIDLQCLNPACLCVDGFVFFIYAIRYNARMLS